MPPSPQGATPPPPPCPPPEKKPLSPPPKEGMPPSHSELGISPSSLQQSQPHKTIVESCKRAAMVFQHQF